MNRLVIIGNGFDLAHDLRTSYEDFINWYLDERFHNIISIHETISADELYSMEILPASGCGDWSMLAYNNSFFKDIFIKKWTMSGREFLEELKSKPAYFKVTCSPFFERIIKSIETKGWVDIENDYYELLVDYAKENTPKVKIDELNKQLIFLQEKLIEYLREVNSQDVEMKKEIKDKIYAPFCERDIAIGGKQALDEHVNYGVNLDERGWECKLWKYGKDKVYSMSYVKSYKEKFDKGEEIFDYEKTEFLLPNHIMLLNFNYTKTADMYVTPESDFVVNHIHGRLDKPESVIFGYGDELDENYKNLENLRECDGLRNIKSIKYLEAENYRKVLAFIESEPYQILIMGHSCGNSDRTLLNTLFEHKNCVSIKPYFYKKNQQETNYPELAQNISRNFNDMKLMRDRVVNKTYTEPLS